MVSSGPLWCWCLLMVVYGPTKLNFGKINSSHKHSEHQMHTPWPHKSIHLKILPLFFIGYWKNSLTHILYIDTNNFVRVEQKFQRIFWRRPYFLFLSLKSRCCSLFVQYYPSESAIFSCFFPAKYCIKLPYFYIPFSHQHLFCFGGIMYHRLHVVLLWSNYPNS